MRVVRSLGMPVPLRKLAWLAAAAALLASVLASGCGHRAPPWESPHDGWQAVRSDHFILYTERYFPVYRYVVNRLEETYAGLEAVFFQGVDVPPVETLMLSDEDYTLRLGPRTDGIFSSDTPAAHGLLVIRESRYRDVIDGSAAHELVHRFIAARFPAMPIWLNEGIATYLETIKIDGAEAEVGRLSLLSEQIEQRQLLSLRQITRETSAQFHGADMERHYHAAAEFVRWLLRPEFGPSGPDGVAALTKWSRLVSPYTAGSWTDETPEQVMARVYPRLGKAEVQEQVQAHIDGIDHATRYPIWVFPFATHARTGLRTAPVDHGYLKRLCLALGPH